MRSELLIRILVVLSCVLDDLAKDKCNANRTDVYIRSGYVAACLCGSVCVHVWCACVVCMWLYAHVCGGWWLHIVWLCVHMCVCTDGSQKSTVDVILQDPFILVFETISHWPGVC